MRKTYLNHILEDFDEFYNTFSGCCSSPCQKNTKDGLSISEDEDRVYIDAELPGVKSDEVEVEIDPKKRHLLLRGENKQTRENAKYHLKTTGSYSYVIPLSNEIDLESKVDAVSKDGILSITLTKNRSHKPLRIDVNVA